MGLDVKFLMKDHVVNRFNVTYMSPDNFLKLVLLPVLAFLLEGMAGAQVPPASGAPLSLLMDPYTSYAEVNVGDNCYLIESASCRRGDGIPPDYTVEVATSAKTYSLRAKVAEIMASGEITCPGSVKCTSSGEYRTKVYAEIVPNTTVRVDFQSSLSIGWEGAEDRRSTEFTFYPSAGVRATRLLPDSNNLREENGRAWSVEVKPPTNTLVVKNGKRYYKLGEFHVSGMISAKVTTADYNSEISNIQAFYVGKVLSYVDGDTQTGRVNGPLPKPLVVKVADGVSGEPVPNAPITFWLADPGRGGKFVNDGVSIITHTDASGLASVLFTLGPSTGTYLVNATCPADVCTSGARQVTFTETAKGTKLACVNCEWYDKVGRELANPFKLQVVDGLTGAPVEGASIDYEVISFTDGNTTINGPSPHGAWITRFYPPASGSGSDGMSVAYMVLGTEPGVYTARARCESCVSGQEQILTGIARTRNIEIHAKKTTKADPEDTPIVQITLVQPPNDGKSFTTADGENRVVLQARLLPASLDQNLIHWDTEDAPDDFIDSGIAQMEENYGPENALKMRLTTAGGGVPVAGTGRALPLGYLITARADVPGKVVVPSVITVKQDQIDKCRQEYIDWSKTGEDLTAPPYFSRYVRGDFLTGIDGVHDPDYVRYIDCYAHIPPSRETEVEILRSKVSFPIDVTSGFRSPRKNRLQSPAGKWNSSHQFGDAVDIVPKNLTAQNRAERFKALWNNTSCPKILETTGAIVMAFCKNVGDSISYNNDTNGEPYNESNMYGLANCLHLGK